MNRLTVLCLLVLFALCLSRSASGSWWGSDSKEQRQDQHHHHHDPEPESDDDPDITNYVTCGSLVKLKHTATGFRLHSHQVSYGSGSGQQSVTTISSSDDNNSLWVVRGAHGKKRCKQG